MAVPIRTRITLFVVTLSLLVIIIAWAAPTSWAGIHRLRRQFTNTQIESFRIADRLQVSVLKLNESYLKCLLHQRPEDRQQFDREGRELQTWLSQRGGDLSTPRERVLLASVEKKFADYLARAQQPPTEAMPPLERYAQLEELSEQLLNYGSDLAEAHRDSLAAFLNTSQRSLANLQATIFAALIMLAGLGVWAGFVVYRELIAPLRVQLGESQATIERQEKLASLGVLAAGVAHEIRNPLTAIKARLFTQRKALPPASRELRDAEFIGHEIDRLEKIVRDFLLFARPAEPERIAVTPADLLQRVHELLAANLAQRDVELTLGEAVSQPIYADAAQIHQVLINLVQNAAESIADGEGRILLRARRDRLPLGHAVVLEIIDNGAGIDADVSKRLFDPFFTTKQSGTGLGLAIAARIVEKHGGALRFQSQVGRGSTFGIVLPTSPPADS